MTLNSSESRAAEPHNGADRKLLNQLALILASGLGVGFSPLIPGTVGSLWGLLLVWGLDRWEVAWWGYLGVWGLLFAAGIPLCARAAQRLKRPDPGIVVWDEIAAFPLVFLPPAVLERPFDLFTLAAGFLWFRLFDIWKPWPVRYFDRLPGGLGIMADDLAAGVYAALALWGTVYFL